MQEERKTPLCSQCYVHIDARAKVCPHCRRPTGKGLVSQAKWKLSEVVFGFLAAIVIWFALQFTIGDMVRRLGEQAAKQRPAAVQTHSPEKR